MAVPASVQKASRARYWVIFFAVTLAILSYFDRVCMSMAMPSIAEDLHFSPVQKGRIFSAFAVAYALFEMPGGWLGDKMGPRNVLMRIVLWWSAFTAFTGLAWNFASMFVTQLLFGAGEAGCFPNLTKAFTTWLPAHERVRAQGIMWMFARWGGAFTPPIVYFAFKFMTWRMTFVMFGCLGLVWAFFFYRWFRDNPRDHKSVNAGELEILASAERMASGHGNVPWAKLIKSRTVKMLWVQYFLLSFPWYFYITWWPTYLKEGRGLGPDAVAMYAIFPLLFGGLGSLVCGLISNRITIATGSLRLTRRLLGVTGFAGASLFIVLSINTADAFIAVLLLGMASFCNDLVMPGSWGACMDVGGRYAGTVSGSMNMMGNLAGFVAPQVGGYILQTYNKDYTIFLYVMAGVYLLGTVCWPLIDPVTPLEGEAEGH